MCGLLDPFVLNVGSGFGVGSGCLVARKMWGGNGSFGFGVCVWFWQWVSYCGPFKIQNAYSFSLGNQTER